jgi:hypothetical protein
LLTQYPFTLRSPYETTFVLRFGSSLLLLPSTARLQARDFFCPHSNLQQLSLPSPVSAGSHRSMKMLLHDERGGRWLGHVAAGGGAVAAAAALMAALAAFVLGNAAAAYVYQVICNSSKALAWMFNNVLRAKFGVSFGTDIAGICKVRLA